MTPERPPVIPAGTPITHDGKWAVFGFRADQQFLQNLLQDFTEEHAQFAPLPTMMSVAQQVRHIAGTIDWFHEGLLGAGFDMDFEKHEQRDKTPCTLKEALDHLDQAWNRLCSAVEPLTTEELTLSIGPNEIMPGASRLQVLTAVTDHTAHHRGSLAVYQRLLGLVPRMIYMG